MHKIALPTFLEPYRVALEKSKKSYVSIETIKTEADLPSWQSKFGGKPYLVNTETYPKDKFGIPLLFLAQINFEEIPPLQGFPQKGLLQFFIQNATELTFGCNYKEPENSIFKVHYIEKIDYDNGIAFQPKIVKHPTPNGKREIVCSPFYPIDNQYELQFKIKEELVNLTDYRIDYVLEDYRLFSDLMDVIIKKHNISRKELRQKYHGFQSGQGHKIGGYPFFTQDDPRGFKIYDLMDMPKSPLRKYNTSLFQMDSVNGIMWGDVGLGHFLIEDSALQQLDFSDVFFYWDCH